MQGPPFPFPCGSHRAWPCPQALGVGAWAPREALAQRHPVGGGQEGAWPRCICMIGPLEVLIWWLWQVGGGGQLEAPPPRTMGALLAPSMLLGHPPMLGHQRVLGAPWFQGAPLAQHLAHQCRQLWARTWWGALERGGLAPLQCTLGVQQCPSLLHGRFPLWGKGALPPCLAQVTAVAEEGALDSMGAGEAVLGTAPARRVAVVAVPSLISPLPLLSQAPPFPPCLL